MFCTVVILNNNDGSRSQPTKDRIFIGQYKISQDKYHTNIMIGQSRRVIYSDGRCMGRDRRETKTW